MRAIRETVYDYNYHAGEFIKVEMNVKSVEKEKTGFPCVTVKRVINVFYVESVDELGKVVLKDLDGYGRLTCQQNENIIPLLTEKLKEVYSNVCIGNSWRYRGKVTKDEKVGVSVKVYTEAIVRQVKSDKIVFKPNETMCVSPSEVSTIALKGGPRLTYRKKVRLG